VTRSIVYGGQFGLIPGADVAVLEAEGLRGGGDFTVGPASGRSEAAITGGVVSAGALLAAGSDAGATETAGGAAMAAASAGTDPAVVAALRCRTDTTHVAAVTVTRSAATPPSSTAANWLRDGLPGTVVAFRAVSTG
jgi:hypothetical protein